MSLWPCWLGLEPGQPPSKPSSSWAELEGSAQMAGQKPELVSGICALTWTYQPPLGSGFLEVSTPLFQL